MQIMHTAVRSLELIKTCRNTNALMLYLIGNKEMAQTRVQQTFFIKDRVSISGLLVIYSLSHMLNSALEVRKQAFSIYTGMDMVFQCNYIYKNRIGAGFG